MIKSIELFLKSRVNVMDILTGVFLCLKILKIFVICSEL